MKISHILFFSLVSFCSCGKLKFTETEINGSAISLTDNSPLKGYSIHLVETYVPSKPFSPISVETIATTVTDENGEFYFLNELRKNSKYEYTVTFDNNGEMFYPEGWINGNYEAVNGVVSIEKEKSSRITLKQIPTGGINFIMSNLSASSTRFTCTIMNELFETLQFDREIQAQTTYSYDNYREFPMGIVTLLFTVESGTEKDTVEQYLKLDHNMNLDVEFVWP